MAFKISFELIAPTTLRICGYSVAGNNANIVQQLLLTICNLVDKSGYLAVAVPISDYVPTSLMVTTGIQFPTQMEMVEFLKKVTSK